MIFIIKLKFIANAKNALKSFRKVRNSKIKSQFDPNNKRKEATYSK